ncbi:MAG: polyprenyl synthetase family protein [Planctomycetota bacterium]
MSVAADAVRARLAELAALVDEALDRALPPEGDGPLGRLAAAMRHSVFAGGKRLRPALVLECCEVACLSTDMAGGRSADALPAACAVEMVHTYSLIHDDLPAMDDDDLRRGRPSCHRAFDEATAILAGDALLALAFETASAIEPAAPAREVVRTLAHAAGPGKLVGGQMMDMASDAAEAGEPVTVERVEAIHEAKTAALIAASCRMGALVGCGGGGADVDADVEGLERYGRFLGHAFQIADDVLDVTSSSEELGKTPGKDAAAGKATYPAAVGVDRSRERARELSEVAVAALEPFGPRADGLRALARFVVERKS